MSNVGPTSKYIKRKLFDTHEYFDKHQWTKATAKTMAKLNLPPGLINEITVSAMAGAEIYVCRSCWTWQYR